MRYDPSILINSLVTGGMWALMAAGLALVFGVMNIPNFAHGEFFMVGTLVAYLIFTPLSKYLAENPSSILLIFGPFLGISTATIIGGLLGGILDRMIFSHMRKRHTKNWMFNCFLVTAGISIILINSIQIIWGTSYKGITHYWVVRPFVLLGVNIPIDRAIAFLIAIVTITMFWILLNRTEIGRAMRAVAQDEPGAQMQGISTNNIYTLTIALSSALAALAGASLLFMFPSYPTVGTSPLYISWSVMILMGLGNVNGAIVGGFIVAFLQTLTGYFIGEKWQDIIPTMLIVLILIIKPSGLFGNAVAGVWERFTTGECERDGGIAPMHKEPSLDNTLSSLGISRFGLILLTLAVIMPLIPPFNREDLLRWLIGATLVATQVIAFDFSAGYVGIVNFGFAAFLGLGSYTSAVVVINLGVSPWIGMFTGALSAGLLGFFTGMLTLRLRGIFAAVMTWFIGLTLMGLTRNLTTLTRGSMGLSVPTLLKTTANLPYFYIAFGLMVLIYLILHQVLHSRFGLAFRAIGQDIDVASASGVNPLRFLIINFTISCAVAGLVGGFYAHYYGILTPDIMQTSHTVEILCVAYIGGTGSLWSGAIVAFPFVFITEWLRTKFASLPGLDLVVYGLFLIMVMIYYPGGLLELFRSLGRRKLGNRQ